MRHTVKWIVIGMTVLLTTGQAESDWKTIRSNPTQASHMRSVTSCALKNAGNQYPQHLLDALLALHTFRADYIDRDPPLSSLSLRNLPNVCIKAIGASAQPGLQALGALIRGKFDNQCRRGRDLILLDPAAADVSYRLPSDRKWAKTNAWVEEMVHSRQEWKVRDFANKHCFSGIDWFNSPQGKEGDALAILRRLIDIEEDFNEAAAKFAALCMFLETDPDASGTEPDQAAIQRAKRRLGGLCWVFKLYCDEFDAAVANMCTQVSDFKTNHGQDCYEATLNISFNKVGGGTASISFSVESLDEQKDEFKGDKHDLALEFEQKKIEIKQALGCP